MRCALPCDRSSVPDSTTRTFVMTPTYALMRCSAPTLEWEVEQVVDGRNQLITLEGREHRLASASFLLHPLHSTPRTSTERIEKAKARRSYPCSSPS